MKKIWIILLILTLATACSPRSTPAPGPASTESPPASSVPPLTAEAVKNAQVALTTLSGDVALTYQLTDGIYIAEPDPATDFAQISLLEPMAFGDMNGDGAVDAAALVAENYGGSGTFVSLVVFLNENGKPSQAAITPVDDRPMIKSVSIEAGMLALEATIHGLEDPMCCPALQTSRHYQLDGSELVLRDFSTQTPDGKWRTIEIASQNESGSSVELIGTITISPFENTLIYRIYDQTGAQLTAGPMMVTAAEMGGPGTFAETINLSQVPSGAKIRIEISDLNAADSSLLAMDSVLLTVK